MTAPNSDWRLQGQEVYLKGVTLEWRPYKRYSTEWQHDHCEFCWAKFAEPERIPEALHEGYSTSDSYRWVCSQCFEDFRETFHWQVVQPQASQRAP